MKKDFVCYYYEKPGHKLKFCNKLKMDKERTKALEEDDELSLYCFYKFMHLYLYTLFIAVLFKMMNLVFR